MPGYTPLLTYLIIGVTSIISYQAFQNEKMKEKLMHIPYLVKNEKDYMRLFTHGLIHANFTHLLFNMIVLWMFGEAIESALVYRYGLWIGRVLFLVLYFGAILFATIPSMRKHGDNPYYRSLGASGAVSAVLIAFMVVSPESKIFFFFIPMPAYLGVIFFFVFEAVMNRSGKSFIAHDAHIWGAIFGVLFLLILDYNLIVNFFETIFDKISSLIS